MENSSQADSLDRGSGQFHAQSLETQTTALVPKRDPAIQEGLLDSRMKGMLEHPFQPSHASGSDFKLSQTNPAPDMRMDQWQVGPHGELVD
jgi:hypothetical protein